MAKYKIGDTLISKAWYKGIDNARIYKIDSNYYHCKIINGIVSLSIRIVDENYDVLK